MRLGCIWSAALVALIVTGCQSREDRVRKLDALVKGGTLSRYLTRDESKLVVEFGRQERKPAVLAWCALNYASGMATACRDLYQELWAAGDAEAYRAFADYLCGGGPDVAPAFWERRDLAVSSLLGRSGGCRARLRHVTFNDVASAVAAMGPGQVDHAALVGLLPTGPECAKDWRAALASVGTALGDGLARAMLRGGCDRFLEDMLKDRPLLEKHKAVLEDELSAPASLTDHAVRRLRAYHLIEGSSALFSPALPDALLDAIRRSAWSPERPPTQAEVEIIAGLVDGEDAPVAEAVLDYVDKAAAGWKLESAGPGTPSYSYPEALLRLARRAEERRRAGLAERLRTGVDASLASLAGPGQRPVALVFEGEDPESFASSVEGKLKEALGQTRPIVRCDGAPLVWERFGDRVRVRVSANANNYCYDKFYVGFGSCSNKGQRVTLSFTYVRQRKVAGSDWVSAETPQRISYSSMTYRGIAVGGPSRYDVWSATVGAVNERLGTARLRLPY